MHVYNIYIYKISKNITHALIGQKFATQVPISEGRDFLRTLAHFIAPKYFIKAI
jgi:hypothetical protein